MNELKSSPPRTAALKSAQGNDTSESTTEKPPAADVNNSVWREVKPPAKQAVVFICQRCERRIDADKGAVRKLARGIKKLSKESLGKGSVRTVMTSCTSLCPRDAVSVAVVTRKPETRSRMYMVDVARPKAAARELITTIIKT